MYRCCELDQSTFKQTLTQIPNTFFSPRPMGSLFLTVLLLLIINSFNEVVLRPCSRQQESTKATSYLFTSLYSLFKQRSPLKA